MAELSFPRVLPTPRPTKRKLASNRSARWAFMEKFEVPNYDGDGNYLTRIRIVQTPVFGIYLHRFDGPDPRTTLHDHPWAFTSIVLRGGYVERRLDAHTMTVDEHCVVRLFNRKHAHNAHAITKLLRVPTWTLMLVGRRTKTWGYWDEPVVARDQREALDDLWGCIAQPEIDDLWHKTYEVAKANHVATCHEDPAPEWTWTEFDKHLHAKEFDAAMERRKST